MKLRSVGILAFGTLMFAGCSGTGEGPEDSVGAATDPIVGPSVAAGLKQVVMISARVSAPDGSVSTRTCSGVYFASRVVATAAHCLDGVAGRQLFVYYGTNYAADAGQLVEGPNGLEPPAPGQPSAWAQADSFESHPSYNPSQIYPDIAVVYLDRKLPFEPLKLSRTQLAASRSVLISGWGANSAPTATSGTGAQVQRTGLTRTLGSPTAADYHPEDPNPGVLVAANRLNLIKLDGRAPNANACFGDSGGPILNSENGQTTVAGINYFTGLACADYTLATRVNAFLPFFDQSAKKGGQESLKPSFDCVAPNAQGTLTAFFGYDNRNGVSIAVPYGSKNSLARDTANQRPNRFAPGAHHFSFGVDFAASDSVSWTLAPDGLPSTTLKVDKSSRRCGAPEAKQTECALSCRASERSGCAGMPGFEACVTSCLDQIAAYASPPACAARNSAANVCTAGVTAAAGNWECFDSFGAYALGPCAAEYDALNNCFFE